MATSIALLAGGCATDRAPPPASGAAPASGATISYETQPCFGACPVYTVTVSADGHGQFTGTRFTAVTGARTFTVDRATYDRFAAALAAYRPVRDRAIQPGSADCGAAATDMSSATVRWSDDAAPPTTLTLYYGCSAPDLAAMKQALRAAPSMLPIADMIGKH